MKRAVYKTNPLFDLSEFGKSMSSTITTAFGKAEEVVEKIPISHQVTVDKSKSLNLEMDYIVRLGDKVFKGES